MEVAMAVTYQDDYPQHVSDYRMFLKVVRRVIAFFAVLLIGMAIVLT
jgi:Bacterial aa3 type cytochrome c oxidase subunit IV